MCARQFLKLHRCDAVVGGGNILWSHASLNKQNIVLNVQLLYVITTVSLFMSTQFGHRRTDWIIKGFPRGTFGLNEFRRLIQRDKMSFWRHSSDNLYRRNYTQWANTNKTEHALITLVSLQHKINVKTKARFGCFVQHSGWKWNESIATTPCGIRNVWDCWKMFETQTALPMMTQQRHQIAPITRETTTWGYGDYFATYL